MSYRERIFKNYRDSIAKECSVWRPEDPMASYSPFYLNHVLSRLPPSNQQPRILDVGCGEGHLLMFLRKHGYSNLVGIDHSPQMVELAQKNGLTVERGDAAEYLRAHPGNFDCVVAMDVLEHLYKDELISLLDAALVSLKPGGRFMAHTVNADGLSWGRMRYIDITHETAFTRYSLAQLFQVTGYSAYEFHPMLAVDRNLRGFLRRCLWKLFRLAAGLYYHMEMGSGIIHNDHILTPTLLAIAVKGD